MIVRASGAHVAWLNAAGFAEVPPVARRLSESINGSAGAKFAPAAAARCMKQAAEMRPDWPILTSSGNGSGRRC